MNDCEFFVRRHLSGPMTMTSGLLGALSWAACGAAPANVRPWDATEGSSSGEARESIVQAHMRGHEKLAEAMRDALIRGDLEEARGEGRLITQLRLEGPDGALWRQRLDAMKLAAAQVGAAVDLRAASSAAGLVAKTCGECHTVFGRPGILVGQEDPQGSGLAADMRYHQRAAERLWEGLSVPSDEAWNSGALALSQAALVPESLIPGKTPALRLGGLAQTVHGLGSQASTVESVDGRAALYGQVLATCAECHRWLGGGPSAAPVPQPSP
jgi:hypothetical protein